jgi:hypothetical protein
MSSTGQTGTTYVLVIRGELDDHFADVFEGMQMERDAGTTIMTGNVVDQTHLFGLLERIQELGIQLVSVEPQVAPAAPRGQRNDG